MQCSYFDDARCRSCTLMGMPYAAQLASKDERCHAALAEAASSVSWLGPVSGPESGFRNKAKLVVAGQPGSVTLGILDDSNRGVDLRACGLHEPGLQDLIPRVADLIDELRLDPYDVPARRGELKHVLLTRSPTGEVMLRFVLRSQRHLALLRSRLSVVTERLPEVAVISVNLQPVHQAILEGPTEIVLSESDALSMPVNGLVLHLRPNSFFQTNTAVAAALYLQAAEWVDRVQPADVLDLYCGVGGFALHAARSEGRTGRRVRGVELSPDAVASARRSAAELRERRPDVGSLVFEVGDATDSGILRSLPAGPDSLVIVNPPRRGIGPGLAAQIEDSRVGHLVYSSCNVESLARDLRALPSFVALEARLFDMFPQSSHHEVAVLLRRTTDRS
ncbi:23S rRNA (uracil(747)-C(5))-methyltransferase [Intrasporangium sp. DVR]|uniref:23S rRNA (uracil(747)-C(5))-methyltransferase n=1 Tax=Intrasporangium sp. DVR TaxID=3127867 RepID=UPI00313A4FAF